MKKLIEENKTFEEAYERLKKASSDKQLMDYVSKPRKSNPRLE